MNSIVDVFRHFTHYASSGNAKLPSEEALSDAQTQAIIIRLPLILVADMLAGLFLLLALSLMLQSSQMLIWFASLGLSCAVRGVIAYHLIRRPDASITAKRKRRFVLIGSGVGGLVWASIWFIMPPTAGYVEYGLVVLWQCGVLAGAAASISISTPVFSVFIASPIVVSIAKLILEFSSISGILMGAFLSYVLFIIPLGLHIGSELRQGIRFRLENEILEENLRFEHNKLTEQESELAAQRLREKQLIDEKKHTGHKLQAAAEERLLLLESIEEGVFGVNNTGKVTFANSSALRMLQYEEDDIIGVRVTRLVRRRGGDADEFIKTSNAMTASYESGQSSIGQQGQFVSSTGEVLPVRFSCRPIRNNEHRIIGSVVSFTDTSKQLEMESALIQSQRIEAIGRITGGISHDFNNLLTVIIGNLQFMRKQPDLNPRMTELIKRTLDAARSGADLVSRLLGFSKEQQLDLETHDINILLLDIKSFLERILGENISFRLELPKEDCLAVTDKIEFQNAIFNLCVNAKDAMPDGGILKIEVSKTQSARKEFIKLAIRDNGTGMPDDVKEHVFEPYFTTKSKEKGFGLGLSTVYGFIKQSGGDILVTSQPGKGTTFSIFLPSSAEVVKPNHIPETILDNRQYSGTILVVEDDDSVRNVAVQMLLDAGFEVITAKDGRSGLEQFRDHPEIDLVFSDIVMPGGMTGIEMAKRILQKRPDAAILFTTGYSEGSLSETIPKRSNIRYVSKPYDSDDIPRVAHSLIDKVAS
jgi:PAS domain S-box-containing protein